MGFKDLASRDQPLWFDLFVVSAAVADCQEASAGETGPVSSRATCVTAKGAGMGSPAAGSRLA